MKKEYIKNLLLNGQFQKFTKEAKKLDMNKHIETIICNVACETQNICAYGIACYLNFLHETDNSYEQLKKILDYAFSYLVGSYNCLFWYAIRRIELTPSNPFLYCLIFCIEDVYNLQNKVLSDEDKYELAQTILRKWPEDDTANLQITYLKAKFNKNNIKPRLFVEKLTEKIIENKREAFKWLILEGRFAESRLLLADFFEEEVEQVLREIATESQSVCVYDYVWFWMRERCGESSKRHLLLADLTKIIFQYQENGELKSYAGTKELYFFHVYRAAELSPDDIEIQEKLLSLYEVGNESFDVEETLQLTQRVFKQKPESAEAQRVFNLIK
jgi:hypothetical protein